MSEQFGVPIAELTWDLLRKMPAQAYRELLGHSEGKAKVDEILAAETARKLAAEVETVPVETEAPAPAEEVLTPEEEAAAQVAAAEAARLAEEAATEQARIEAEAAVKAAQVEAAKPRKYVYEFQATDEQGNPIGNKTHLEASSQEELDKKKETAYLNAVRAIDRLKRQKPTFRREEVIKVATQEELDAAAKDLTSSDPAVRAAAVRKLAAQEVETDRQDARLAAENARQAQQSLVFLGRHLADYNNCQANNEMLAEYIKINNLEWTTENLEIAFDNIETQLAPVARQEPEEIAPSTVANSTAAVAPAAPIAPAAPVVPVAPATPAAAVTTAPVTTSATPNPPAAPVRRPGVNAGLVPGQTTTGVKPLVKEPALTKKDIAKMTPEEMKRRHKLDPKFYDQVTALFAKK